MNLKNNPCCEEPDYRYLVLFHLPHLAILDQHEVRPEEVLRAKELFDPHGQVAGTIAFGQRRPPFYGPWNEKVPDLSELERQLQKHAAAARAERDREQEDRDTASLVPAIPMEEAAAAGPASISSGATRTTTTTTTTAHASAPFPPPPPGWSEELKETFQKRYREGKETTPRVRPDPEAEEREKAGSPGTEGEGGVVPKGVDVDKDKDDDETDEKDDKLRERRVGENLGFLDVDASTLEGSDLEAALRAMRGTNRSPAQGPSTRIGTRTKGEGNARPNPRTTYVARDVFTVSRVARAVNRDVSYLDEPVPTQKSVRFDEAGVTLDASQFAKYSLRKKDHQPGKIELPSTRI